MSPPKSLGFCITRISNGVSSGSATMESPNNIKLKRKVRNRNIF